jgi:hypothetical protein
MSIGLLAGAGAGGVAVLGVGTWFALRHGYFGGGDGAYSAKVADEATAGANASGEPIADSSEKKVNVPV